METTNQEKPTKKIKEYKRTCKQCGKVWHSLVSREGQLNRDVGCNACIGAGNAVGGNLGASTQAIRNTEAQETTLASLKKCPKCGSQNYKEEIISYEKH